MTDDAGYAAVPRWMIRDERFTANMLLTFMALQSFADQGGIAFPSIEKLARRARLGRSTVRSCIRALERVGVVETRERRRDDGGRRSNIYVARMYDPARLEQTPRQDTAPPSARSGRAPRQDTAPELHTEELTQNELLDGGRAATPAQRAYLTDLHIHGGGKTASEIVTWLDGLTAEQADAEIQEALAVLPRGRHYEGDPEHPDLSEKGREVAAARMIPRRSGDADRQGTDAGDGGGREAGDRGVRGEGPQPF